jgi:hypothetical protein
MKVVYFTNNGEFATKLVDSEYSLAAGETFTEPKAGIKLPTTFDSNSNSWIEATEDEHAKYVAEHSTELLPDPAMTAINALGIQVAQLTAKVEAQAGGAN